MVQIPKILSDLAYKAYEKKLLKIVKSNPTPNHIAVIMDGNRRFAQKLGLAPIEGHELGRDKLE